MERCSMLCIKSFGENHIRVNCVDAFRTSQCGSSLGRDDDLFLTGGEPLILQCKRELASEFEMKDLL